MKNTENIELLLKSNHTLIERKNISINDKAIEVLLDSAVCDGTFIRKLMKIVNTLDKHYSHVRIPIKIFLGEVTFKDKLTYIMLEILCLYIIQIQRRKVTILMNPRDRIDINGIGSSPLMHLAKVNGTIQQFENDFMNYLKGTHYRNVIQKNDKPEQLSEIYDEINHYLSFTGISQDDCDELADVVIELIGNATEHGSDQCLVDIDVANTWFQRETKENFIGINVVILNFSENLLGTDIQSRLDEIEAVEEGRLKQRYVELSEILDKHKNFLSNEYLEEDFYNISSFQHNISGDLQKQDTGGTGLTTLISSLTKRAKEHQCYVITGNRTILLNPEVLKNKSGWIGFNEENDFENHRPSKSVLHGAYVNIPGVAYNLNFIMKRGEGINEGYNIDI